MTRQCFPGSTPEAIDFLLLPKRVFPTPYPKDFHSQTLPHTLRQAQYPAMPFRGAKLRYERAPLHRAATQPSHYFAPFVLKRTLTKLISVTGPQKQHLGCCIYPGQALCSVYGWPTLDGHSLDRCRRN